MKSPPERLADRLVHHAEDVLDPVRYPRLEDVARLLGVSRASLYYWFSGRDDLVAFLLARHVAEGGEVLREAAATPGTGAERLDAVLSAMLRHLAGRPAACSALLAAFGSAGRVQEVLRATDEEVATVVRDVLAAGADDGTLVVGDVTDAANALVGAALLAVLGRAAAGGVLDDAAARRLAAQLVGGLRPR
ncbi:TetR/AcrR family transcriptional regulator [Thalassiella azotivora]